MSFLDSIGDFLGFNNRSRQQQDIQRTENSKVRSSSQKIQQQTGAAKKGTVAATDEQQRQGQTTTSRLLNQDVENTLSNLILALSPGATGASGIGNEGADLGMQIARSLAERAGDFDNAVDIDPIITEAERQGRRNIEGNINNLASRSGSRMDSSLMDLKGRQESDLVTQLAGLEAELLFAQRDQGTKELLGALSGATTASEAGGIAGGQNINDIATLAEVLKGAVSTQQADVITNIDRRAETQEAEVELQELLEAVEQLQKGNTVTNQTGNTEGSNSKGLFDLFNVGLNLGR